MKPRRVDGLLKCCFFLCCFLLLVGCETRYDAYSELRAWAPVTGSGSPNGKAEDFRVWTAPDDLPGSELRRMVDTANKRVDLNVYLLSDVGLINSLILAARRGISVRVILERSVYNSPTSNQKVFQTLESEGVAVVWADEVRQNFNHAKYVLADDVLFLGTGNFTTTSFTQNREFFIQTSDPETVDFMNRLFEADYYRFPFAVTRENAYVSPIDSRSKVEFHLRSAKKSIRIFAASLSDERMLDILAERRADGLGVEVCLAYEKNAERTELSRWMRDHDIVFHQAKSPHVHAKTILFDDRILLIGSENFTKNSLEQNREVGLILQDSYFVEKYREIILQDCRDG